jgi:phosphatidylserine/phosphatidylglycerophosphate/cardiolipin synthase-like enzyme
MAYKHRTIRTPHIIGMGLIATFMGVYHFASDNGLLGLIGFPRALSQSQVAMPLDSNAQFNPSNYGSNYVSIPGNNAYGASGDIRVYFSPGGGCTDAIVNEINQAQRLILIQAYSFTSQPIAAACVAAHQRGVQVYAMLDKSQESEQYSAADFLANSGIPTVIDAKHQIAHNKVILIDGRTLITGSFNFTTNAEKSNAENLLIIHDRPDLYSAYEGNIRHHYEHCTQYTGRGAGHAGYSGNTYSGSPR